MLVVVMIACRCTKTYCWKQLRKFVTIQQRKSIHTSKLLDKGVVLGVYKPADKDGELILTKTAQSFDQQTSGQITKILKGVAGKKLKDGGCRVLYDIHPDYTSLALCCVDEQKEEEIPEDLNTENIQEALDRIRIAAANGVKALRNVGEEEVDVETFDNAYAAAEGSYLGLYVYDELKEEKKRKKPVSLQLLHGDPGDTAQWNEGKVKAEGQNIARRLMEMPSNHLTPTLFAKAVQETFTGRPNVTVTIRDKSWIEDNNMRSFLAVSQGSNEPPVFLEIEYKNSAASSTDPIALVGKGVTFDTGGISIKPSANMDQMRADMGGAACVVGSLFAIDQLNLPINVHGFIPLCENMPGGRAIKPGDVVIARNGKSIQIDNTDAEGRLILADALDYADTVNPQFILDMATLTGAIDVALGSGAAGVYSTSNSLWKTLEQAGSKSGDRVWRMPLFKHYSKQVTESALADVNNIGKYSRSGGSCTAAAFLKGCKKQGLFGKGLNMAQVIDSVFKREFVKSKRWIHIDIAGVMSNKDEIPYLCKGMAGRPTRTIVEFIQQLAADKH